MRKLSDGACPEDLVLSAVLNRGIRGGSPDDWDGDGSEWDEDSEDGFDFDCHMDSNGMCDKAGSEECDWECPYMIQKIRREKAESTSEKAKRELGISNKDFLHSIGQGGI